MYRRDDESRINHNYTTVKFSTIILIDNSFALYCIVICLCVSMEGRQTTITRQDKTTRLFNSQHFLGMGAAV